MLKITSARVVLKSFSFIIVFGFQKSRALLAFLTREQGLYSNLSKIDCISEVNYSFF